MNFDKIRYFLTLAESLSYTKASTQLFISQSMLSRHIKSAEEEFGVTLFTRNTRGVALTPAGSVLAGGLRNLRIEYGALLEQARSAQRGYSGEIRIGVLIAYTLGKVSEIITQYEAEHPDLHIVLSTISSPGELYNELMNNRIDFGLGMSMESAYYPNLASLHLHKNPLCVVMSKRHPLAGAEKYALSINDFKDETFITPADETSTGYRELLSRCSAAGFAPKVITAQDIMSVALWVEANYGVTFLHETSAFSGNPNLVFNYLNDVKQEDSYTIYRSLDNQEPRVLAFLEHLRKCAEN